jgi:hypothetical protein
VERRGETRYDSGSESRGRSERGERREERIKEIGEREMKYMR